MHPSKTYVMRRCCESGPGSAVPIAQLAEAPAGTEPAAWTGPVVGRIEAPDPLRMETVAVHEAAHAVIGIALGARVEHAQIDGAPLVRFAGLSELPWPARVAINEAGDLAQHIRLAWPERPDDAELREHTEAIRDFRFGACDRCQTFSQIVRAKGLGASDHKHIECYRSIERETRLILERTDVWMAVRELSEMLWEHGVINGNTVHQIVERHVPRGSILIGGVHVDR